MLRRPIVRHAVIASLSLTLPIFAHHSFSAEFDINKPVTLRGTLTQLEWINPHSWLHIDVRGPDGKVVNWAIETGGPNTLLRRGVRENRFSRRHRSDREGVSGQERHFYRRRPKHSSSGRAKVVWRYTWRRWAGGRCEA